MIKCINISKSYGNTTVFDKVDIEFDDIGFYVLMGESGCGKTTLLNILSGMQEFDGGCVEISGQSFTSKAEAGEGIGYITQDSFFADFLNVRENLELAGASDEAIDEALTRFGLKERAQAYPDTLSGGERQKLAVIRALLNGCRILLLDEPTASLDRKSKEQLFGLLKQLGGSMTVIAATHDRMAEEYADSVVEINKHDKTVSTRLLRSHEAVERIAPVHKKSVQLTPFLNKWFKSAKRKRSTVIWYRFLMFLSFLLICFFDTEENKKEQSEHYLYDLNVIRLRTRNEKTLSGLLPEAFEKSEVIIDYGDSLPLAIIDSEAVIGEISCDGVIPILPSEKHMVKVADLIEYGEWFTAPDQVILSHERALFLNSDPGEVIGTAIQKNIYGIGKVELTVVGVIRELSVRERLYFQSFCAYIDASDAPDVRNNQELFFVNGALLGDLESNESLFFKGHRGYLLFFDSYDELKSFRDGIKKLDDKDISLNDYYISGFDIVSGVCRGGFVLALFMSLMSTLFYIELSRMDFEYDMGFISVFEYCGFKRNKVIGRFVLLFLRRFLFGLLISGGAALIVSLAFNEINRRTLLLNYWVFSCNPLVLIAFSAAIFILGAVYTYVKMKAAGSKSWYEGATEYRDIL